MANIYEFKDKVVLPHETATEWQAALYRGIGLDAEDALVLAKNLVTADLRGVYSHGIQRTPNYARQFVENELDAKAKPEVIKRKGALAVVDGHNASGIVTATFATCVALGIAREFGTASVSVMGGAHLGACAAYVEMAAEAGMLGFCWSNGGCNLMAPYGGKQRQLGSNPVAIGAPCHAYPPMILDMATSTAARGKVMVAALTGADLPEGWALDVDGKPTTDSREALAGVLLPFGSYKGSGLALMNAVVTGVLLDSNFGPTMPELQDPKGQPQNGSHLIQVIDIAAVGDADAFRMRMDKAVEYIKGGEKADGFDEILVPGEPEARNRQRQERDGIAYPKEVIEQNCETAARFGVPDLINEYI